MGLIKSKGEKKNVYFVIKQLNPQCEEGGRSEEERRVDKEEKKRRKETAVQTAISSTHAWRLFRRTPRNLDMVVRAGNGHIRHVPPIDLAACPVPPPVAPAL